MVSHSSHGLQQLHQPIPEVGLLAGLSTAQAVRVGCSLWEATLDPEDATWASGSSSPAAVTSPHNPSLPPLPGNWALGVGVGKSLLNQKGRINLKRLFKFIKVIYQVGFLLNAIQDFCYQAETMTSRQKIEIYKIINDSNIFAIKSQICSHFTFTFYISP